MTRFNSAIIIDFFRKIMKYDFNKDNNSTISVEENIMGKLTNDLGQSVLPHVAHIMLTEFRKFMFLVEEHNYYIRKDQQGKILKIKNLLENDNINSEQLKEIPLKSLLAPPSLDQIWCLIILMPKIYSQFCEEIFGGYLDRKYFMGIESHECESYSYTLELLGKFEEMILPFKSMWPNYNMSCYLSDYLSTSYIFPKIIPEIICAISDYNASSSNSRINKIKLK